MAYVERTMIHRWNAESKAHKKAEQERKRKSGGKSIRR